MLHLIWTKDNSTSTSEDGTELKGIRPRLLECYRILYFEPVVDEALTAKDQVQRIAKNMIEYISHRPSFILYIDALEQTYVRCDTGRID